ncbi:MAG TPA: hypothetical protein VGY56_09295 [Verrucomicrobiae bacterium]|nr:hypothetical protein [Verrucomicrobiae bacterium]
MKNQLKNSSKRAAWLLFLAPLLVLAFGCRKEQVQVYRVSDSQDQPAQQNEMASTGSVDSPNAPGQMPSGVVASDVQNAPPVIWSTPAGWTQVPPSEMRVGSFRITGAEGKQADLSIIPLPGMAGGDLPNVNRWREQVGLQPASDDQSQSLAENFEAGGQPAQLYDLAGANPASGDTNRILAAIQHRDGTTWFFKMTGDADLVEQQKQTFIAFLRTLNFGAQQTQGALPAGHPEIGNLESQSSLPAGHPAIGDMAAPAPSADTVSGQGQPTWQIPADWQPVSAGQFLVAKFALTDKSGATATVNVSSSPGNGGGLAPNVNRWREQLGLQPVDEVSTVTFAVPGGQAQLVDISGASVQTGAAAELVGVVVTLPDRTWFYKLMGNPALVAAQKDAFTQFVKGVKY